MDVFLLWHIYTLTDDDGPRDEVKLIGAFSSEEKAQRQIEALKDKPGFYEHPLSCFEVHRTRLDQPGWTDGFCTMRWRE